MRDVFLPHLGSNVRLVSRGQLRAGRFVKRYRAKGVIPPAPAEWDHSKSGTCQYPLLGNDRYGDCYEASAAHQVGTWTNLLGSEFLFDEAALIKDYLRISGGDNGLDDAMIMTAWKAGLVGSTHKILDYLVIPCHDSNMAPLGYHFGGLQFTLGIPDAWLRNPQPGSVWDAGSRVYPDDSNGHAVHLTARRVRGYDLQTWGFKPPVLITHRGLEVCDGEALLCFSLDWFNSSGYAPCGMHYVELAALWHQIGGRVLPPSPYPAPVPVPPPPTPIPPLPPVPPVPVPPPFGQVVLNLDARTIQAPAGWILGVPSAVGPCRDHGRVLAGSSGPARLAGLVNAATFHPNSFLEAILKLSADLRRCDREALCVDLMILLNELGICLTPDGNMQLRSLNAINWPDAWADLLSLWLHIRQHDLPAIEQDLLNLLADLGLTLSQVQGS